MSGHGGWDGESAHVRCDDHGFYPTLPDGVLLVPAKFDDGAKWTYRMDAAIPLSRVDR